MRKINLNHFLKGILFLVLLSGQLLGQSNVVVTVFNQPGLNGSVGSCINENENLNEIINALPVYTVDGTAIVNFTNTSALQTALDNAQFFFMTDMESGNPNLTSFLPNAAKTILHDFVDDGGVIVQTGTFGNNDHDFLNQIFGWNLSRATGTSWAKVTANTAGTPFDAVSGTSLPNLSATDAINKNSVPNFTTMYGTDANAVVAVIQYGSGYVIFLGYDYFNTGLNPSISSPCSGYSGIWVQEVIPAALAYATQLSSSAVDNITETTADFDYKFSENATSYYVVVPAGSTAPTEAQIKAGIDYGTVTLVDEGSATTTANTMYTFALSGLTSCTDYDIYAVSEWNDSGTLKFSSIESTSFSTVDLTPPSIAVKNITVPLDPSTNTVIVTPSQVDDGTTDNCGTPTLSLSKSTFSCADVGANIVTLTATDAEGLTSSSTATITVTKSPVVFSAPSDVAVTADISSCVATSVSLGTANITGQCYTVTNNAPSSYPIGSTTVTWTLTESDGTITTDDQLVVVQDTFNPVLVLNTGVVVNLDASGTTTLSISDVDNGSYDDCGLTHVSFVSGSLTSSLLYSCSDVGSQTVNVFALDDSGNESLSSFTFTVADIIAPTFTTTSPSLYLDVNGNATLTASDIITSVVENCSVASTVLSKTSFDCGDVGSNTVTITITDVNGNSTTATEIVTIVDTIAPDIHVTDVQVSLGADGRVVVTPSLADDGTTDACGSLVWTLSDSTFDCSDIGAHLEMATVTNVNGISSSASIIITVADNSAPIVVTRSATIYLDLNGQATLDSTDVIDYIQENCSLGSITLSQVSFNASTLGSNTVTVTVTDASGNVSSGLAIVTVVDNIAPTAVTKDIILPLDAQGQGSISTSDIDNGSSDNVSISTYAADVTLFDCNDLGDNWVVLTVTDASGSSDTAWSKVTVVDNAAPSVVAQNYSVALDASGTATVLASQVDAGTSDNCGVASLTLSQTSFSCSDLGQNTLTFTAIDGSGNSSTASVVVTVTDDLAPTVVTQSATLYLNAMGMVTLDTADVISSAIDNCGISVMSLSNTSFGCTDVGTNQVTLNVTDGSNNTAVSVVSVTVLDTITPTITMADTVTVYANATCGASVTWAVLADDNCSYTLSSNYASGSTFNIGYHNVITTVTDPSGNAVSATTVIEVLDTLAPVWTSSSFVNSIVPNTASCGSFVTWIAPVAFDLCSNVSVTASATNGSSFGLGTHTVTFTATDAAGNSNTQSITFTVVDDIAPEVIVPSDIVVNNDAGQCGASVTYAAAFALDNCNLDTVYYSHAPGTYFPVGQNQVTVTALDAAGNTSSGMFTITVVDNEAPTLLSVPNDTVLGYCNASFVYPTPSFDDNCGVFSVTLISGIASGNVFPVGTTENIYVATDVHGNTDTVAFNVTVINQYPATIPFYGLVCSNSPNFDLTMGDSSLVFTGNYVTNNSFSPSTSGPGEHNLVYAFTDSLGCVSYGTLTLTVEEAPTMPVVQRLGANYLTTQHYDQYQWYLNGNPIPGATSQNLVASVAGNYKVKVWNTAGCSRISSIMAVGTIGLDEASVDDLKVYPNPSQGQFNIDMVGVSGTITLKIYDSMGRFISEQALESGYVQMIEISNASSGMYQLVLMDSDGHVVVRRVTIQK